MKTIGLSLLVFGFVVLTISRADEPKPTHVIYRAYSCIMAPDLMNKGKSATGCDPVEGQSDLPLTATMESCEKNLAAFAAKAGDKLIDHKLWSTPQGPDHPLSAVWYECRAVPVQ
jgi:hypothetical protein